MNGPYAGTSQHGNGCFGCHGHVYNHPVAFADALRLHSIGKFIYPVVEFTISDGKGGFGRVVGFPDNSRPVTQGVEVAFQYILSDIELATYKPFYTGLVKIPAHYLLPELAPMKGLGYAAPELLGLQYTFFILMDVTGQGVYFDTHGEECLLRQENIGSANIQTVAENW